MSLINSKKMKPAKFKMSLINSKKMKPAKFNILTQITEICTIAITSIHSLCKFTNKAVLFGVNSFVSVYERQVGLRGNVCLSSKS